MYQSFTVIALWLTGAALMGAEIANNSPAISSRPTPAAVELTISGAQRWLLAQQQDNGAFLPGNQFTLGITALAVHALTSPPLALPADEPHVAKAIRYLHTFRQADGGFYHPEEGLGGYGTALTLMAFSAAKVNDVAVIRGAQNYLFGIQNQDPTSVCIGGIGYGPEGPGQEDLHNTATAVVALRTSGISASDPRLQQALRFIESCQNLSHPQAAPSDNKKSTAVVRPWVNNDGGAVYSPTESKAGGDWNPRPKPGEPQLRLHSYGSMTHALIESYLTLDVPVSDQRVRAALGWIRANYGFDANPGMPDDTARDGLFYFYASAAKTFDLADQQPFALLNGQTVDWRTDLFAAITKRAHTADGGGLYGLNPSPRWGEAIPHLVTTYIIQSLKRLHLHL
jgi:squalene-hopene/tetraprenyl-beta-curcumene cyclase